jgi:hypothetical protein
LAAATGRRSINQVEKKEAVVRFCEMQLRPETLAPTNSHFWDPDVALHIIESEDCTSPIAGILHAKAVMGEANNIWALDTVLSISLGAPSLPWLAL